MSFPQDCTTAVPKVTAAEEVCRLANEVLLFAENLAQRLECKLNPITEFAPPAEGCKNQSQRILPPLFNEYRGILQATKDQLYRIEDTLNRVEV